MRAIWEASVGLRGLQEKSVRDIALAVPNNSAKKPHQRLLFLHMIDVLKLRFFVLAWAMLQQPCGYVHAWVCRSLIQSLDSHRFDFQVWPQSCFITVDSTDNCWMVSDPGYCFQTYPNPDLLTQLPGLTSGLIYHQGFVCLSGFFLNLVINTRRLLFALLGCCGTGQLSVMQLPLPPLVLHLDLSLDPDRSDCSILWPKRASLEKRVLGKVQEATTKLLEIPAEYKENFKIRIIKLWNRLPKVVSGFPFLKV